MPGSCFGDRPLDQALASARQRRRDRRAGCPPARPPRGATRSGSGSGRARCRFPRAVRHRPPTADRARRPRGAKPAVRDPPSSAWKIPRTGSASSRSLGYGSPCCARTTASRAACSINLAAKRRAGSVPLRARSSQRSRNSRRVTSVSASASAFTDEPTGKSNNRLMRARICAASSGFSRAQRHARGDRGEGARGAVVDAREHASPELAPRFALRQRRRDLVQRDRRGPWRNPIQIIDQTAVERDAHDAAEHLGRDAIERRRPRGATALTECGDGLPKIRSALGVILHTHQRGKSFDGIGAAAHLLRTSKCNGQMFGKPRVFLRGTSVRRAGRSCACVCLRMLACLACSVLDRLARTSVHARTVARTRRSAFRIALRLA